MLVIPFAIQPWASYLDRQHVVAFRSVHGWVLVSAAGLLAAAILLPARFLVWPGAVLMGVSLAAGNLGWSLGHNDFAPRGEETRYMALHVTLTGLRGLLAPPLVVAAYYALEHLRLGHRLLGRHRGFGLGRDRDAGNQHRADRRRGQKILHGSWLLSGGEGAPRWCPF